MHSSIRTVFLAVVATVALPGLVVAQPMPPGGPAPQPAHKPTRIGAKIGLNSVTMSVSGEGGDADIYDRAISLAIGGAGVLAIDARLGIQVEALYIRKGSGIDLSDFGGGDGTFRMDYIEVPVHARYALGPGTGTTPFVYGGAAVALYLSGEIEVDGDTQDIDGDNVTSIDLALQVGAGLELPMSSGAFTIDARYSHGLINADDTADSTVEIYHRVISVFGGVLF